MPPFQAAVAHNKTQINQQETYWTENLPLKLGLALLLPTTIILFLWLIYLIFRRLRKYKRLLDDEGYNSDDDGIDDEITQFDKEKLRLATSYQTWHQRESPVKPNFTKPSYQEQNMNSAFSLGDEGEEADVEGGMSDSESGHTTYKSFGPIASTKDVKPVTIVTSVMNVSQSIVQREPPCDEDTEINSIDEETIAEANHSTVNLSTPNKNLFRRASSTPNLQINLADKEVPSPINPLPSISSSSGSKCEPPVVVDDSELFIKKVDEDEEEDEKTLIASNRSSTTTTSNSTSVGDIGSIRPLLPIRLPQWAMHMGKAERGFLVFALGINRKPGCAVTDPRYLIDVQVLEARCILSHHVETVMGKFYVKARLQQPNTKLTSSVLSLNHTNTKPKHLLTDRLQAFTMGRHGLVTCGSTPIRRAYRSPVFFHAITLETTGPNPLQAWYNPTPSETQTELRLDLKERHAMHASGLYGSSSNLALPNWRQSKLIGSVCLPITRQIWNHFNQFDRPIKRSTLVTEIDDDDAVEKGDMNTSLTEHPNILRFVRRLEIPVTESSDRGELTIGIQYNPDTAKLTLTPLKCSGVNLPRGTRSVFLRASLTTNRKLLQTKQSNSSARLSMHAAEFLLGERLQFSVEEHVSQVCLVLNLFARTGTIRLNETVTLIGRCVVGPDGLAYGQGLEHWNSICNQRGMIKRNHVLF